VLLDAIEGAERDEVERVTRAELAALRQEAARAAQT
jgi:hypothetical protein